MAFPESQPFEDEPSKWPLQPVPLPCHHRPPLTQTSRGDVGRIQSSVSLARSPSVDLSPPLSAPTRTCARRAPAYLLHFNMSGADILEFLRLAFGPDTVFPWFFSEFEPVLKWVCIHWVRAFRKGVSVRAGSGKECKNSAWSAVHLAEDLDLEVHVRYAVISFHSLQEALGIYSVHPDILDVEIEVNKVIPLFCKFTSEPHFKAWTKKQSLVLRPLGPLSDSYAGIRRLAMCPASVTVKGLVSHLHCGALQSNDCSSEARPGEPGTRPGGPGHQNWSCDDAEAYLSFSFSFFQCSLEFPEAA